MIKNTLSKNSGITLLVLVITIIVIIILSTVTINAILGDNGLMQQAQKTKDQTENSITSEETETNGVLVEYANVMEEDKDISLAGPQETPEPDEGGSEFIMDYGVVEIKWLQGNTDFVASEPNAPKVKNISNGTMSLVRYDESSQTWVDGTEYSYVSVKGSIDNNSSKWANARVTIDGIDSYFVWIPRYAYRIVYFNSEASKNEYKEGTLTEEAAVASGKIVGYSDSRGIVDKDGKKVTTVASTAKPMVSSDYFMVHPAFTNDVTIGGWSQNLEGIWIGKYEACLVDTSSGSNIRTTSSTIGNILLSDTTNRAITVQPNMSSWRYISIGNMYTNARDYSKELESHMLKNSEWGAVAYLTESSYGRNGTEVTNNNSSNYITGIAGNSIDDSSASGTTNEYNTEKGVLASSTGNVYGIYDLSGGIWERTASYYNGEDADTTSMGYGSSFASIGGKSDAYSTVYNTTGSGSDSYKQNYIYGDATYETAGWHSDYAYFVYTVYLFFLRSGGYSNTTTAGVFYFGSSNGNIDGNHGFRLALSVL